MILCCITGELPHCLRNMTSLTKIVIIEPNIHIPRDFFDAYNTSITRIDRDRDAEFSVISHLFASLANQTEALSTRTCSFDAATSTFSMTVACDDEYHVQSILIRIIRQPIYFTAFNASSLALLTHLKSFVIRPIVESEMRQIFPFSTVFPSTIFSSSQFPHPLSFTIFKHLSSTLLILMLSNTGMSSITNEICRFASLLTLQLVDNGINAVLPSCIQRFNAMQEVVIQEASMMLDIDIFQRENMMSLRTLSIVNTPIIQSYNASVSSSFNFASTLESLTLFQLDARGALPDLSVDTHPSLRVLNVSHNAFTSMSPSIFQHTAIQTLDASHNQIKFNLSDVAIANMRGLLSVNFEVSNT